MHCNYFQTAALEKREFTLTKTSAWDMSKQDEVMELVDDGYVEIVEDDEQRISFRVTEAGVAHSDTLPNCE